MHSHKSVERFLSDATSQKIIDVRAPLEFIQGHIPGAINIPLFDNEQRAEIGTLYHEQGRTESVLRGLDFVGPAMRKLAEEALAASHDQQIFVHCSRGGMRSQSFAWLAQQVGLQTHVLPGGYKAYRQHVLGSFAVAVPLIVLSGLTGAGKTIQIQSLKNNGEQVIDLEALANHRGSAFGGIGQGTQPTTEQFENNLHAALDGCDRTRRIWIEDESRNIGSVKIPNEFFHQIRAARALFMDVDFETRRKHIRQEYGALPVADLVGAIEKITKRLGGQNVQRAVEALAEHDWDTCIEVLLGYYDKLYLSNKGKMDREVFMDVAVADPTSQQASEQLIALADSLPVAMGSD